MLILVIAHLFSILPWYLNFGNQSTNEQKTSLKLLHSNVLTSNKQFSLFSELIEKEDPNIIVLQEVNQSWINALTPSLSEYKYRIERPQNDNFGIAVYSKFPFINSNVIYLGDLGIPSIEITFSHEGQGITLLATHPIPPINNTYYSSRNKQLMDSANRLANRFGAKILIGDFNTTMWSSDYFGMESVSGLSNARKGFGILPTWPTNIPFLMIPIDHVLTSNHFVINNFTVGDNIGSDHLPIIVDLAIAKTE